jgi:hypothetical protein
MGFLFQGSGGTQQAQQQNASSNQSTTQSPEYMQYVNQILQQAQGLGQTPYQGYDVSKMFAPFTDAQNQAFGQIQQNASGAYQPYYNAASGALGNVAGYNPQTSAQPALDQAGAATRPWDAGQGFLTQSAGAWNNPQTQSSYMDPYTSGAIGRANQLTEQNFAENTMPTLNSQFVKGQGQLGRQNYQNMVGRATRDLGNTESGNAMTMENQAYWNAANQFNTDQSRMQSAGSQLGSLANTNMGALTNLASTNANITSGAINSGIGMAGAYSNLGGALSNTNLINNQALLAAGNQQQQQNQLPLTAQYQQFQQAQQWPFQMVNFMNAAQRGLTIPQYQSGQQSSTSGVTGSSTSNPSIAGDIFGTLGAINTLGSSTDASGKTTGGIPNIYNAVTGPSTSGQQYGPPAPQQQTAARGGRIRGYAQGGPAFGPIVSPTMGGASRPRVPSIGALGKVGISGLMGRRGTQGAQRKFDVGGSVPVKRGIMSRKKPPAPQGMGPPGGMPMPPMGAPGGLPLPPAAGRGALGGLPPPGPPGGIPMPPRGGPPPGALSAMR